MNVFPVLYPIVCFDERIAKKYGVCEAILFNEIAHDITAEKDYGVSREHITEGDSFWVRFYAPALGRPCAELFGAQEAVRALRHLETSGLLRFRPDKDGAFRWIALGGEPEV